MVEMGQALSGTLSPLVGGHQSVIQGVDAHLLDGATDPYLLPNQPIGRGVVGFVELDVAIPTELDLLPHRHIVRCFREWL